MLAWHEPFDLLQHFVHGQWRGDTLREVRSHFARDFVHESETVTFRVFPLQIALKHNT